MYRYLLDINKSTWYKLVNKNIWYKYLERKAADSK